MPSETVLPEIPARTVVQYEPAFFYGSVGLPTGLDILTTRVTWDFQDPWDKCLYRTVGGWSAAHLYEKSGRFVARQKLVTRDDRVYVRDWPVNVARDYKPTKDIPSFSQLASEVLSPNQVLDCGKRVIDFDRPLHVAQGIRIKNGKFRWPGMTGGTFFTGRQFVVRDSIFDQPDRAGDDGSKGMGDVLAPEPGGAGVAMVGCQIWNTGYVINGNKKPQNILVINTECMDSTGVRGYTGWIEGQGWFFYGVKSPNSVYEHIMRIGGARQVVFYDCHLHNVRRRAGEHTPGVTPVGDNTPVDNYWDVAKAAVAAHLWGEFQIISCHTTGPVGFGPLGGSDGVTKPGWRTDNMSLGQLLDSSLSMPDDNNHLMIQNGCKGLYVDGNAVSTRSAPAIFVENVDKRVYDVEAKYGPPAKRDYSTRWSDRIIITPNNTLVTQTGRPLVSVGSEVRNVENAFAGKVSS